jgi:hypothetical protein
MGKKIIKKKTHRVIWRIFTILIFGFLMVFFFGAYTFYTKETDYPQRTFESSDFKNIEGLIIE